MTPGQFTALSCGVICVLPFVLGALGFILARALANRYPVLTITKHPATETEPGRVEWFYTIQDKLQQRAARMADRWDADHV